MIGYNKGKIYIIDDLFPHPRSVNSWRGTEFHAYLDVFFEAQILTSLASVHLLDSKTKNEIMIEYQEKYPQYSKRISVISEQEYPCIQDADLAYFIFLNNAWNNLNIIEKNRTPFILELYPGGGLALSNMESDKKLEAVMNSDCYMGVIVSNYIVYHYLIDHGFCDKEKICLLPGCVMNNQIWQDAKGEKHYYGIDKEYFDIAFASYRYSKCGEDKGYDVFIELAKALHEISDKFHVTLLLIL